MAIPDPSEDPKNGAGRWLRVLSPEEFARMMGAAMEASLIERGALAPARARFLGQDALRRFAGLVRHRGRRVRRVSREDILKELEETHGAMVRDRQRLREEITELEGHLKEEVVEVWMIGDMAQRKIRRHEHP